MNGSARHIRRLVGVYDADGTVRGEVAYWIGARLGRKHCSLCDITHGSVREKREWAACKLGLPVPFDTYHRDDQPDAVRAGTSATVPVVAAETEGGDVVVLLDGLALDACGGEPSLMMTAIEAAVETAGLRWPAP